MKNGVVALIVYAVRLLLALRYRIHVKNDGALKALAKQSHEGFLLLPNHPAEIDPVIIEALLWRSFDLKPVIIEHFYHLKGWQWLIRLTGAVVLPTMDSLANRWRAQRVQLRLKQISDRLDQGERFLVYPSGRLKVTGWERLGGASFVHQLLQAAPKTRVLLLRTTGLWGSQFSKALTGSSPEFGRVLGACFKILLKNGLFFTPRRSVLIEWEEVNLQRFDQKLDLNRYLEEWYNRYPESGPEPLTLVPYFCWRPHELPQPVHAVAPVAPESFAIDPQIAEQVIGCLAALSRKAPEEIQMEQRLSEELGLDSLDLVQVHAFLDERYAATDLAMGSLQSVKDVLQAACGQGKKKETDAAQAQPPFVWPHERRPPLGLLSGSTLQEVFLRQADAQAGDICCVDDLSGPLSYKALKMRALLLAEHLKTHRKEQHIGILLPSSVAAYTVILAVLLAGKVPVMLNWTAGKLALDHAGALTKIQTVLTSMKFLDRLDNIALGNVEERFYYLEDLRQELSWKAKCRALWRQRQSTECLLCLFNLDRITPQEPAVILFTSGTESLPKAVPLSHENLLSNQRAALAKGLLNHQDILYGVLPPFHSFGFSVTGLLPLLAGLRVCYAPDPTDSHKMAKDIQRYQITALCSAPSFLRALFRVAPSVSLQTLRLIVSGAERLSPELCEIMQQKVAQLAIVEGYGITECSPIVTVNATGSMEAGVGQPLDQIKLRIMEPDTQAEVIRGQEGEVYIQGPNVFNGYLCQTQDPFFYEGGQKWYRSGDRGSLDAKGNLILSGRSKRFIKIGAEMVGLDGIEKELLHWVSQEALIPPDQEGPVLAVTSTEHQGDKPEIFLFTTLDLSLEEVNRRLKQVGFGRLVKVSQVRQVKNIPLIGAGKVNYRGLA